MLRGVMCWTRESWCRCEHRLRPCCVGRGHRGGGRKPRRTRNGGCSIAARCPESRTRARFHCRRQTSARAARNVGCNERPHWHETPVREHTHERPQPPPEDALPKPRVPHAMGTYTRGASRAKRAQCTYTVPVVGRLWTDRSLAQLPLASHARAARALALCSLSLSRRLSRKGARA